MIRPLTAFLSLTAIFMFNACDKNYETVLLPDANAVRVTTNADAIPVILDTDIGNDVDDTWALLQFIRSPELDPKLILTASGDTVLRAKVTAKYLEASGRSDIPLGIGLHGGRGGVENQKPWVKSYDFGSYPGMIYKDGVQAMIDAIHASPEPVTLIVIGPATNIAEALKRDPSIAPKTRFIGMHGSVDIGYGGGAPANEYNVKADLPAFRAVLAADWLNFEITPLDSCGDIVLGGERYQRLFQSDDSALVALFENYKIFAERVKWMKVDYFDTKSSTLFDCVAVYMAYSKEHLVYETIPLSLTEEGSTIRDTNGTPVKVAMSWTNQDAFYSHLAGRLAGIE